MRHRTIRPEHWLNGYPYSHIAHLWIASDYKIPIAELTNFQTFAAIANKIGEVKDRHLVPTDHGLDILYQQGEIHEPHSTRTAYR
jgi:hypothetical protein